jgi:LysR family hydrogen peroxide-inducible transcriptional activator
MNLRDLKYIVTLADTLNFNRAAEICFVSQPSLSKQIQKVEDELGVILFERSNRKVSITPTGERVVARARAVLRESDAIRQIAKEAHDPLAGEFKLGIIPTVAPYILPRIMPAFSKSLPRISMSLFEGHTVTIIDQLKRGQLDAILLALPLEDDELQEEALYSEPFYFATPMNHPLASRKRITIEDLAGEKLLLLEDGHCLRAQALQVCRMSGGEESQSFSATSMETLCQMVAAGNGVTLVPALASESNGARLKYISFKEPIPSRLIGLAWRKSSPRRKLLSRLSQIIQKEMKEMPRKGLSILPVNTPPSH